MTGGSAALAVKVCKHNSNDAKCLELGCPCIPIAVETLRVRGYRGHAYLVTPSNSPSHSSHAIRQLYGQLSLSYPDPHSQLRMDYIEYCGSGVNYGVESVPKITHGFGWPHMVLKGDTWF